MTRPSFRSRTAGVAAASALLVLLASLGARAQAPPVLEPGGPGAASSLTAVPGCSADEIPVGQVLLGWRPAAEAGAGQQVQVTIFRDGFETGRYVTIRDLEPSQTELLFEQVAGQAVHRWRVLTLQADGLAPSETAQFEGPICVRDEDEAGQEVR